jgi:hypothetical protein
VPRNWIPLHYFLASFSAGKGRPQTNSGRKQKFLSPSLHLSPLFEDPQDIRWQRVVALPVQSIPTVDIFTVVSAECEREGVLLPNCQPASELVLIVDEV